MKMNKLNIEITESGYAIVDKSSQFSVFEGIQSFGVACELHEMLIGELEES
jgi:hypothetical protein